MTAARVATRLPVQKQGAFEPSGNQVATRPNSQIDKPRLDPWQPGCQCKGERQ